MNPHREGDAADYFVTSDQCIACHSNIHTRSGEDVSIGYTWRGSMMANSSRDPYWHAAVRREVMDHPSAGAAIEDKCSTCHMPMARFSDVAAGGQGEVFANLAASGGATMDPYVADGVSCTVCHQIRADNFGEESSFTGGFEIDAERPAGEREIFGPHDVDAGRRVLMSSAAQFLPAESQHLKESELCATCHTLYTHALDESGREIAELPEQVPYLEWLNSSYRETRSCQDCHMPEVAAEETPISSVLGQPRPNFSRHVFRGGNAFMLGILNRYRGELGVRALPQELDSTIRRTRDFLRSETANVRVESATLAGSELEFGVFVENLAGHKLPTAYPSRRAWLHVTVTDATGTVLFESGTARPDGSIVGNDNDADASRFEPHYERIRSEGEVQIYEPIMVDVDGRVTTGLLSGVRYVKDNRILPAGFDKAAAPGDVAVHGAALGDGDFVAGGDRVTYVVDVGDADEAHVAVSLEYQSIGYRWAHNLGAYDAAEPQRFVRYYEASAADSAMRLASHEVDVERR